jgi:hypothetical protein
MSLGIPIARSAEASAVSASNDGDGAPIVMRAQ